MVPPTAQSSGSSVAMRLSSDFKNFSIKTVDEKPDSFWSTVLCEWPSPLSLSKYNKVALHQIQMFPLHHVPHAYSMNIRSNLVGGSVYNPRDEMTSIYIPKHSRSIPNYESLGESYLLMTHSVPNHHHLYNSIQFIIILNYQKPIASDFGLRDSQSIQKLTSYLFQLP